MHQAQKLGRIQKNKSNILACLEIQKLTKTMPYILKHKTGKETNKNQIKLKKELTTNTSK